MRKGTSKWFDRRELLEKMIGDGLSSEEMGLRLGVHPATITYALRLLGLPSFFERSQPDGKRPDPVPLVGETYVDADGLKVTRYPARIAYGADMQSTVIRGKGKRR